jgi:hypothetical protein
MKQLLLLALMVMSLAGQNIQHTRRYTIKGGRMAEFESIVKDLNALYKKAGVPSATLVFQSITGPEQVFVTRYYEKVSQALANRGEAFKGPHEAEYRALNMRLMNTVEARETRVAERDAELSLPRPAAMPAYIRVIKTQVKPGKVAEVKALVREWVDGGIKPAGVKVYTVTQTRMGGPTGEIVSVMGVNSLAELDELAPRKAMGDTKYNAWSARREAVIEGSEVNVLRFRPELSSWTAPK